MGQVCTHVWVEEEGHKRRGLGKGKEEEKARGKRRSVQRKEIERGHIIAMWKQ